MRFIHGINNSIFYLFCLLIILFRKRNPSQHPTARTMKSKFRKDFPTSRPAKTRKKAKKETHQIVACSTSVILDIFEYISRERRKRGKPSFNISIFVNFVLSLNNYR